MKKVVKYFPIVILLLIIGLFGIYPMISYPVYQDGLPTAKKLNKEYLELGEYVIGKYGWKKYMWDDLPWNICNDVKGCFNGKIISMKADDSSAYIYYNLYNDTYTDDINIRLYNESCNSDCLLDYEGDTRLPEYFLIDSTGIKLYSENEILNLGEEEKIIFKNLKDNDKIIINGKEK